MFSKHFGSKQLLSTIQKVGQSTITISNSKKPFIRGVAPKWGCRKL